MEAPLFRELLSRRFAIRSRWETLLRVEPVRSPLGLPDALVHLIDSTLEEIFAVLGASATEARTDGNDASPVESACLCGRNPLLAYFEAGDQAVREGLILAQAALAPLDPVERDTSLQELNDVLRQISQREIEAFCGICQFRHLALPAAVESLAINSG